MTSRRVHSRCEAAARTVDNLALALPAYRDVLLDRLSVLTGFPDHTPGAAPATVTASKPLEGKCAQPIRRALHVNGQIRTWDRETTDFELVDCGRPRPCPEHDRPVQLTPTEQTAEARAQIRAELADIDQVISTITLLAHDLLQRAHRAVPPTLQAPLLCRDGQAGKDGTITWGDPTCSDAADKAGLCPRHYMAWYRWRKASGADTDRMFQPTQEGTR